MTQEECVALLRCLRWPDGPVCPHCAGTNCWLHPDVRDVPGYVCQDCRRRFTLLTGTPFQYTRLPLPVWFAVIGHLRFRRSLSRIHRGLVAHLGPVVSRQSLSSIARKVRASDLCREIDACLDDHELEQLGVLPPPRSRPASGRRARVADHPPNQAQLVAWQAARITWPSPPSRQARAGGRRPPAGKPGSPPPPKRSVPGAPTSKRKECV